MCFFYFFKNVILYYFHILHHLEQDFPYYTQTGYYNLQLETNREKSSCNIKQKIIKGLKQLSRLTFLSSIGYLLVHPAEWSILWTHYLNLKQCHCKGKRMYVKSMEEPLLYWFRMLRMRRSPSDQKGTVKRVHCLKSLSTHHFGGCLLSKDAVISTAVELKRPCWITCITSGNCAGGLCLQRSLPAGSSEFFAQVIHLINNFLFPYSQKT